MVSFYRMHQSDKMIKYLWPNTNPHIACRGDTYVSVVSFSLSLRMVPLLYICVICMSLYPCPCYCWRKEWKIRPYYMSSKRGQLVSSSLKSVTQVFKTASYTHESGKPSKHYSQLQSNNFCSGLRAEFQNTSTKSCAAARL